MNKFSTNLYIITLGIALSISSMKAQIQVTQNEFYHLFTPGAVHYYAYGSDSMYNIGNPGGPNIYNFTSIDLQNPNISNNILIDDVPALLSRYESGAVTFGDNAQSIEKNPVFYIKDDSMFTLGETTIFDEYRFKHYRPYELVGKFPITYGHSFSQMLEMFDSTYSLSWQLLNNNHSTSLENTIVDGYGTLQLANGNFPCLRIKKEHTGYGDKEFFYITNNGVFVGVGGVPLGDPDQGTVHGGAQVLLAATLLDAEEEYILPNEFWLRQNYPNPFNPSTKISWQTPVSSHQTLKIFDVLGNEVATLVDEFREAGRYEVEFSAAQLSSGIYFYQIQTGTFFDTRKMILMK